MISEVFIVKFVLSRLYPKQITADYFFIRLWVLYFVKRVLKNIKPIGIILDGLYIWGNDIIISANNFRPYYSFRFLVASSSSSFLARNEEWYRHHF